MKTAFTASALTLIASVGFAAPEFNSDVNLVNQHVDADNTVSVVVGDYNRVTTATAQVCGFKGNRVNQRVSAKNTLSVVVGDSNKVATASAVAGSC